MSSISHERIRLVGVDIAYNHTNPVLTNISLTINTGDIIAILGPSGIGKSTLLASLSNPNLIINGQYYYDDVLQQSIHKRQWRRIIRDFSYLDQTANLVEWDSVYTNIARFYSPSPWHILNYFGALTRRQRIHIATTLEQLGILDKIYTRVNELSGGERQRVELCKTLLSRPSIVLADEPTSALDIDNASVTLRLLATLAHTHNAPLLFVTHDRALATRFATKIIDILDGRLHISDNVPMESIDALC